MPLSSEPMRNGKMWWQHYEEPTKVVQKNTTSGRDLARDALAVKTALAVQALREENAYRDQFAHDVQRTMAARGCNYARAYDYVVEQRAVAAVAVARKLLPSCPTSDANLAVGSVVPLASCYVPGTERFRVGPAVPDFLWTGFICRAPREQQPFRIIENLAAIGAGRERGHTKLPNAESANTAGP